MAELTVFIAPELCFLQKKKNRGKTSRVILGWRASVKDIVEALGIPHTEIWRLVLGGHDIDFSSIPEENAILLVQPCIPPFDPMAASLLRPDPLVEIKFAADANVGKLAMLLRASGFDTWYENGSLDARVAHIAEKEQRIVLTRDAQLLKRSNVEFGRYVSAVLPDDQLLEIMTFFGAWRYVRILTRCFGCNTLLEQVLQGAGPFPVETENKEILPEFQPLFLLWENFFQGVSP